MVYLCVRIVSWGWENNPGLTPIPLSPTNNNNKHELAMAIFRLFFSAWATEMWIYPCVLHFLELSAQSVIAYILLFKTFSRSVLTAVKTALWTYVTIHDIRCLSTVAISIMFISLSLPFFVYIIQLNFFFSLSLLLSQIIDGYSCGILNK